MTQQLDLVGLRDSYRKLVLWVGVQIVLSFVHQTVSVTASSEDSIAVIVLLGSSLGLLATLIFLAIYGYRTAAAIGYGLPILWAVLMFVPCINILTLLAISSRATKVCRENGIPVGFFGPKLDQAPENRPGRNFPDQ